MKIQTVLLLGNYFGLALSLNTLPAWLGFASVIAFAVELAVWAESC